MPGRRRSACASAERAAGWASVSPPFCLMMRRCRPLWNGPRSPTTRVGRPPTAYGGWADDWPARCHSAPGSRRSARVIKPDPAKPGVRARNSATNSPPKRAGSSLGWEHAAAPSLDTARAPVRLAFRAHICGLVPPGSLAEVPTCRSWSRPGRPPPMVLCPLLGLPAGGRVDPPGLVEGCGHGLQLTSADYLTRGVKVPAPRGQLPAVSPPCALRGRRGRALRVR
jgi:hypothetical protein